MLIGLINVNNTVKFSTITRFVSVESELRLRREPIFATLASDRLKEIFETPGNSKFLTNLSDSQGVN